ncbi:primosomal protein N' [Helicobacter suis]|uniref:primosomal protein N' n=1 Tax=Helicobacter suis TaxID=104628 RepID=UPI0013D3A469|nr:primosomal protein N' [Helicobacter suis]
MLNRFYSVAPLKHHLKPLTYKSQTPLAKGDLVQITLRKLRLKGVVLQECEKPPFDCVLATQELTYFNAHQMLLLEFIAKYYCCSPGLVASLFIPFNKNNPPFNPISTPFGINPLSFVQNQALEALKPHKSALLFGDTGSGKTQIYIHLIVEKLQKNQSVIVLVPEIALTSQTQKALIKTFANQVGLWHSKLSTKQKQELLKQLALGQIRVVVGTRSALFLPMPNLGLILVDEEHDQAYKASQAPYYNARDIALYLSSKMPIQVILGSATPHVRSYYLAKKNQTLVRLKGRFFNTSKEILFEENKTTLSQNLLEYLTKSLEKKEQSVIFLPTRASFKKLLCYSCGNGVQCPFCSVNMSLHLKEKCMRCHYCQHQLEIPKVCPTCKQPTLAGKRIGTQQLKSELEAQLPQARIQILDKDHTHTASQIQNILDSFNRHECDILIGTQMLAKGHDYPKVNLAIILGLDEVLNNGSYRSLEDGVSLMHQIAGRSARKEHGKVVIQTLNAAFLKRYIQDYEDFLKDELQTRMPHFPPFMRLAQIEFRNKDALIAQENMQTSLKMLQTLLDQNQGVQVLGSGCARVAKIAGKYRYQILLSASSTLGLHQVLHHLQEHAKGIFKIDVDPLDI